MITEEELKILWFRDKAYLLKQPSIDREDNDGNYCFKNCRFIEKPENSAKDKRKSVIQYTLNSDFIREWESIIDVEKNLNINNGHIGECCKGKRQSAGKFIWKFKKEN